jgi:hypothetical protein
MGSAGSTAADALVEATGADAEGEVERGTGAAAREHATVASRAMRNARPGRRRARVTPEHGRSRPRVTGARGDFSPRPLLLLAAEGRSGSWAIDDDQEG